MLFWSSANQKEDALLVETPQGFSYCALFNGTLDCESVAMEVHPPLQASLHVFPEQVH